MDAAQFVAKWQRVELTERSAAQQHYLDLCDVFDHPKPADADPAGTWYTFERKVEKAGGRRGFADVWKKGQFAWEYKKKHRDLNAAFDQLLQYSGNLGNPPLLLACDMDRIVVRTHFTGFPTVEHEITLDKFALPRNLELLRKVFHEPDIVSPGVDDRLIPRPIYHGLSPSARCG